MTLLRKSFADEIGLQGVHYIQLRKGMHAMTYLRVESVALQIRGIHKTETFKITDVNITDTVPELQHSLTDVIC